VTADLNQSFKITLNSVWKPQHR